MLGLVACLLVAAAAVALAFRGASAIETRSVAAVLLWWLLAAAVATGVWPRASIPRAAVVAGLLLAAFTVWLGASSLWSPSAERAIGELSRMTLYLGAFLVSVVAVRRADGERWADGLALGIAVVGVLALAQRLFPGFADGGRLAELLPSAASRLSYPLGYWNGLGIFLGLAFPLLLRAAAAARPAWARGLAVAPIPALAAAVYLTSSRGGAAVVLVGVVVFVLATARRFAAVQAVAVAVAGSAGALAVLTAHPVLVDGPLGSPAVGAEGDGVALAIAAICLATGAAYGLLAAVAPPRLRVAPAVPRVAIGVVAALLVAGALVADPAERVEAFKAPPTGSGSADAGFVRSHLLSGGGSGRWQFWSAAVDQFEAHPVAGGGAGSYEPWWAQHGSLPSFFIRNAHSLWLETLGELGIVGALLLAGAFATGLVCAVRRLFGAMEEEQALVAALGATLLGFIVGAALDWVWQLPVVAMVGMVVLGLLTGPAAASSPAGRASPTPRRRAPAAALLVAAVAVIGLQAVVGLGDAELQRSRAAAGRGDLQEALDRAAAARAIQPWSASPHLQLALVWELAGDLPAARRSASEAIERDGRDWRLRVVAARLATKAGAVPEARAALRAARRLNPRSGLLGTVRRP